MASESDFKREMRKEIRELKSGLDYMTKDVEDLKKECAALKKENSQLKTKNEEIAQELAELRGMAKESSLRITAQDQYSRNKNLEVKGIPQEKDENLVAVLTKVGDALGEQISEHDVEICHRIPARRNTAGGQDSVQVQSPSSDATPGIVVVFKNRLKRDAVLGKARKTRVATDELGFSVRKPVFVNEHLCPPIKRLLGMTIAKKKEMNWRFAWTKDGKVYARQTEQSRPLLICCEADLAKMRDARQVLV